jgi:NDP-sugar pyrophosphorylase family protein
MNLVIIETDNNSRIKTGRLKSSKGLMKINGEYLIERIIRIGRTNGITNLFYIINSYEPELKQYMSTDNFGLQLNFIELDNVSPLQQLIGLTSFFKIEPFFLVNANSVFLESEFSEFVAYSLLQEDSDGALAVTKHINDDKPLSVAMNDEDIILKFNDSKDGYNWVNGGIYYFSPSMFDETKYALQAGIVRLEKFLQLLIFKGYILRGFSFSEIVNVERAADISEAEDLIRGNE